MEDEEKIIEQGPIRINANIVVRLICEAYMKGGKERAAYVGHECLRDVTNDQIIKIAKREATLKGCTPGKITYEEFELNDDYVKEIEKGRAETDLTVMFDWYFGHDDMEDNFYHEDVKFMKKQLQKWEDDELVEFERVRDVFLDALEKEWAGLKFKVEENGS